MAASPSAKKNAEKPLKKPDGPSYLSYVCETVSNRLLYYRELMITFGDIVKIPSIFRIYMANKPDLIRYILKTNVDNYPKGEGLPERGLVSALGHGLLDKRGAEWAKRKSVLAPYFRPSSIKNFAPIIQAKTLALFERWEPYLNSGESFDIANEIAIVSIQVAAQMFYHLELKPAKAAQIVHAANLINKYSASELGLFGWLPTINGFKYRKNIRIVNDLLSEMIKTRRKLGESKNDLLDIILAATYADNKTPLTEQDILDEVKTSLLTGHVTTATALGWTFYHLAYYPKIQKKMQDEVKEILGNRPLNYSDLAHLKYTRMVFEETLRILPPIPLTRRKSVYDDNVGGKFIKANSDMLICPYTVHHNPEYWDDPDAFIPERHSDENRAKRHPFSFIPFSGGPRMCIGSHLAMMESVIILAMVAQRYTLELDTTHKVEMVHYLSLKTRNGVKVKIRSERSPGIKFPEEIER